jgi:tRNA (guanine-N7-)-methyltransferase
MLKSYVLRTGRFTNAQKNAYEAFGGRYIIPFGEKLLNYKDVFENDHGVTLEIGFGMGLTTAEIAQTNPCKNYLGIEVHKPGVGRLLWEIHERGIKNIRIIEHDAVFVLEKMITGESLDAVHVFFPDPWPKKRHHKRRLIQRPFTDTLAQKLSKKGYLYMVTDWEDYALSALEELQNTALLINTCANFAQPQAWRPATKFEKKGIAQDHAIYELYFERR